LDVLSKALLGITYVPSFISAEATLVAWIVTKIEYKPPNHPMVLLQIVKIGIII
jgi:hypothetical protein